MKVLLDIHQLDQLGDNRAKLPERTLKIKVLNIQNIHVTFN